MLQMGGMEQNEPSVPDEGTDDPQRVGALRGAGVEVDVARVGYVAAALGLFAVIVVAGVLVAAGIKKNDQIVSLQTNGVPVELTVTRCLALVGGTGQSPAGFECTGTYVYRGRHYTEGIPGSMNLPVGSTLHGTVASSDPALFSTPLTVASERASVTRILIPAVVLAVTVAVLAWTMLRRRGRAAKP
jgi:hypothetical protein